MRTHWRPAISVVLVHTAKELLVLAHEPLVCNQACLEGDVGIQALVQLSNAGAASTTHQQLINEDGPSGKWGRNMGTSEAFHKLMRDCGKVKDLLLPQMRFEGQVRLALGYVAIAVFWFTVFFKLIYQDDHNCTDCDKFFKKKATRQQRKERGRSMPPGSMAPDVILVFDNPGCHPPDRERRVSMQHIENVLLSETCWKRIQRTLGIQKVMPMSSSFMDLLFVQSQQRWVPATEGLSQDQDTKVPRPETRSSDSEGGTWHQINRSFDAVRIAMMQDLANLLLTSGFDLKVHKSPDHKHLFFFIGLCNDAAMEHYIVRDHMMLHVKSEVVQHLGLNLPDEAASTTVTLPFDPRIVSSLHKAGFLEEPKKTSLFRTFKAPISKSAAAVLDGASRSRIILRELTACIDLDAAKGNGLLVDWYPVHSWHIDVFKETWGSWRQMLNLSFTQPITPIKEYFGSRVAFIFSFKGFFCKALMCLLPVAAIWEITRQTGKRKNAVAVPCMLFTIWTRMAFNGWSREQKYLSQLWNEHIDRVMVRPQFRGFPGPSTFDANEVEDQYPPIWSGLRQFCSMCITSVFCALVWMCIFIWMHQFKNTMDLSASLALTAIIKSFDFIYSWLVLYLTHFDNHKYETDYFNCLVTRRCLFQAVTNYSAFFSLVFKQALDPGMCGGYRGCLVQLRHQLIMTQIILSLYAMGEVAFNVIYVRMTVWLASGKGGVENLSFAEEQRHYVEYRTTHQAEVVSQLMISLGFIILFGAVAPVMVPFTFLVFVIQLRGYAMILTSTGRRTLPREAVRFTAWQSITNGLMHVGVFVSGIFVVSYGGGWHNKPLITKMTGCTMVWVVSFLLWALADFCIPPESSSVKTLAEIRRLAVYKIIHLCAKVDNLLKDQHHELWHRLHSSKDSSGNSTPVTSGTVQEAHATSADAPPVQMPTESHGFLFAQDWSQIPRVPLAGDESEP